MRRTAGAGAVPLLLVLGLCGLGAPSARAEDRGPAVLSWESLAAGGLDSLGLAALPAVEKDAPEAAAQPMARNPWTWRERADAAGTRHEVTPGVELAYQLDGFRLIAVFVLRPGGDAAGLALEFPAGTPVEIGNRGHVKAADFALLRPGVVQLAGGEMHALQAGWETSKGGVQLALKGDHDAAQPVIARFEVLFLNEPETIRKYDRNGDGRVDLADLGRVEAPTGGVAVTATNVDTLVPAGDGDADPGDTIQYDVTVGVTGAPATGMAYNSGPPLDPDNATTFVANSVNVSPLARDDGYTAVGNVTLSEPSPALGILGNDSEFSGTGFDPACTTFALTQINAAPYTPGTPLTLPSGASLTVQADGTFTYTPGPSQPTGIDLFTYTIADGCPLTSVGSVSVNVAGKVWFVDSSDVTGPFLGTQANPFNVLDGTTVAGAGGAGDVDAVGDYIYLFDTAAGTDYPAGLELEPDQKLVGSGVALVVGATTVLPAGTPPTLANGAGNGVTMSSDSIVRGLTINAANNAGILAGGSLGTLATAESSVSVVTSGSGTGVSVANVQDPHTFTFAGSVSGNGSGPAVSIVGQDGSLNLGSATLGKTGGRLIEVANKTGGTVSLPGATITGGAANALLIQNNSGTTASTFSAPVSVTAALTGASQAALRIDGNPAGSAAFSGGVSVTTSGAGDAVSLQTNGSTASFNGGLTIDAGNGRGILANGGGTVNVAGTGSTVSATNGPALDVTSTTFGGGGATFASVTSGTSTTTGVNLNGVTGALVMNGGSISGSTGTAFNVAGGGSGITYAGTISKTNAGRAVDITNRAGGTLTFSNTVTATGASTGINVSGATVATTVDFTNAVDLGTSGTRLTGDTALTVNHGGTASSTTFSDLDVFTTGEQGISASNGGTLTVTTGQVDASGGRALNLDGLALGTGSSLTSVASSASSAEGIRLNAATGGPLVIGTTSVSGPSAQGISIAGSSATVNFASSGSTTVSGGGTQRILVTTTTGNVTFGNTTLDGGTDGISLQNNSAGLRSFNALSIGQTTPVSGIGFLHSVGGGDVTVAGTAFITNPGGTAAIEVQGAGAGHDVNFSFNAIVTKASGPALVIGTTATNNATSTVEFGQLSVTTSNGTAILAGSAGTSTPLGIHGSSSISATGGAAISAQNTAFNASTFNSVTSTNSSTQGLNLLACTGSLNLGVAGSISGSAGTAVNVDGGSPTVSYGGTVTQNNAQRVVQVQNTAAGSLSLAGTVTGGASSTGVNINAANGGVSFTTLNLGTSGSRTANQAVTINGGTGTYSLGTVGIFTTGGTAKGISAVNADGTLNSTAGEVNALGAPAIDIDGPVGLTTLGMTLTAVAANGGANGLLVRDTNGSFSVAGTGGAGTGGSIQSMTARGARFTAATNVSLAWMSFTNNGTNQTTAAVCGDALNAANTNCGAGIDLQGVTGVTLDRIALSGGSQMGINGNNVTNLTMTNTTVQNAADEVLEDGVQFANLKGTCSMTDVAFTGNFHRQLEIQNSNGTLTSLSILRGTFDRGTYVSTAAQGVLIASRVAGTSMNVSIKDSDFLRNFGSGFFGQSIDTSTNTMLVGDLAVPANGNVFTNNSLTVQMVADNGSTQTGTVANNSSSVTATVTSGATPFSFRKSTPASGLVIYTMTANSLGNAAAQSGNNCAGCNGLTITNEGTGGGMRMTVNNNVIRHVNQRGMEAILQLDDSMGVVVTGNTIQDPDGTVGQAVFGQSENDPTDAGTLCMDVTTNVVGGLWDTGVFPAGRNMRLRQGSAGGTAVFRLRNIAGTTATDCNNRLNADNTNALAGCSAGSGFTTGAGVCF